MHSTVRSTVHPMPTTLLLAVLLSLATVLTLTALAAGQPPSAAGVAVAPVETKSVAAGQTFVGTVKPVKHAIVGSAVDGRVVEFPVNEGDRVSKGQPLAQLLTETISLELEAAKAELDLRSEELAELENGSRPEEIEQARARMAAAQARREYMRSTLERKEALYKRQAVPDNEYEEAISAARNAQEEYLEAKASYELIKAGPRKERIAQARARVAMQQALVEKLSDQIKKHTMITRFDGYVTAEHTEIGQWVSRGDPVAEVAALDEVDIEAHVVESHAPHIGVGDSVRVEIPALADEVFTGKVVSIVPRADMRTRTVPIKVRVANTLIGQRPQIMAGMLARVTLSTGPTQQSLLVPKDALVLGGPKPMVWVTDPQQAQQQQDPASGKTFHQGEARSVPVELGVAVGDRIAVKGELQAGELVVVRGNERIRPPGPGQPAAIRWEAPAQAAVPQGSAEAR